MQINALNVEFQKFQFQTKTASMYIDSVVVERNDSQPPLDWTMPKNIALGSARGIAYLHYSCDPPKIIHRDVKAANIYFL